MLVVEIGAAVAAAAVAAVQLALNETMTLFSSSDSYRTQLSDTVIGQ